MKEKNIYNLIESLEGMDSLLYSLEDAIETLLNDKANERNRRRAINLVYLIEQQLKEAQDVADVVDKYILSLEYSGVAG